MLIDGNNDKSLLPLNCSAGLLAGLLENSMMDFTKTSWEGETSKFRTHYILLQNRKRGGSKNFNVTYWNLSEDSTITM